MGSKNKRNDGISVRSLDQLKTLDSLDIEQQLSTATALCNHAHRSDMILRWLLPKLQDSRYASKAVSWILLTRCIRLVQPSLLGSRLKSVDLVDLMAKALVESPDSDRQLVEALHDFTQTLLAINERLLAASADVASNYLGAWLRTLYRQKAVLRTTSDYFFKSQQVWALRRGDGDELFTERCLLPAALLLTMLKPHDQAHSAKRVRDGDRTAKHIPAALQLERLIAKHVFLKSRAAFLRQDTQEDATAALQSQVASLGVQIEESHENCSPVFATLLNVAIRCGSISRQTQALAEIAWYDAVFVALSALASSIQPTKMNSILQDMLTVIKERSTLSLGTLHNVVEAHGQLERKQPSWDIIRLVMSMNPRVFSEETAFNTLAQALEKSTDIITSTLIDCVITPLIEAFTQDRRLLDFVALWQQRIDKTELQEDCIWFKLDGVLENRLEEHLTHDQVTTAFSARCDILAASTSSKKLTEPAQRQSVAAACTTMSAILRGVHTVELENALLASASSAFAQLEVLAKSLAGVPGAWLCALQLFDLCAPRWLSGIETGRQRNATDILTGDLVKYAMKQAKSTGQPDQSLQAARFLGKICQMYRQDESSKDAVSALFKQLVSKANQHIADLLIQYPALFPLLEDDQFERVHQAVTQHKTNIDASAYTAALVHSADLASSDFAQTCGARLSIDESSIATVLACLPETGDKQHNIATIVNMLMSSFQDVSTTKQSRLKALVSITLGLELQNKTKSLLTFANSIAICGCLSHLQPTTPEFQQTLKLLHNSSRRQIKALLDKSQSAQVATILHDQIILASKSNTDQSKVGSLTMIVGALRGLSDSNRTSLDQQLILPMLKKVSSILLRLIESVKGASGHNDNESQKFVMSSALQAVKELSILSGTLSIELTDVDTVQRLAALIMTETTPGTSDLLHDSLPGLAHPAVRAYEVMCYNPEQDAVLLAHAASRLLNAAFSYTDKAIIRKAYGRLASSIPTSSRLLIVQSFLGKGIEDTSASDLVILQSTLELQQRTALQPEQLFTLNSSLLSIIVLTQHNQAIVSQAALRCLAHLLQHSSYMANQHAIDETLKAVSSLARANKAEVLIFPELCSVVSALLKSQRARLNGRFHILLPVLQALLKRLLAPVQHATDTVLRLTSRHAHSYSRVLSLLCDPPKHRKQRPDAQDSLVDEARRLREQVGSFMPVLLHSYCSLVLKSPPTPEIKDALTPGLWAVMSAMEMSEAECMSILGSAMNDSERAVLRAVVEEWRTGTRTSGR